MKKTKYSHLTTQKQFRNQSNKKKHHLTLSFYSLVVWFNCKGEINFPVVLIANTIVTRFTSSPKIERKGYVNDLDVVITSKNVETSKNGIEKQLKIASHKSKAPNKGR